MALSKKRETAIYRAVFDRLMDLRVQLQMEHRDVISSEIDHKIAQAMERAANAAVRAAKGESEVRDGEG